MTINIQTSGATGNVLATGILQFSTALPTIYQMTSGSITTMISITRDSGSFNLPIATNLIISGGVAVFVWWKFYKLTLLQTASEVGFVAIQPAVDALYNTLGIDKERKPKSMEEGLKNNEQFKKDFIKVWEEAGKKLPDGRVVQNPLQASFTSWFK